MEPRFVLVCVATLSCRNDAPPSPSPPAQASPHIVPTDAAQPPVDVHASALASRIVIRDDGIGPIDARTTTADLARILPELERDGELRWDHEANRSLARTWFSRGDQPVLSVDMAPDGARALVRVHVTDGAVSTEAGAHVGQPVAELVRIYPDLRCTLTKQVRPNGAVETTLIALTCATRLLPHVRFGLVAGRDRPPGEVAVATLAGQTVDSIVWAP